MKVVVALGFWLKGTPPTSEEVSPEPVKASQTKINLKGKFTISVFNAIWQMSKNLFRYIIKNSISLTMVFTKNMQQILF